MNTITHVNIVAELLKHIELRVNALEQYVTAIKPDDPKAKVKATCAAAGFVELKLISSLIKEGLQK